MNRYGQCETCQVDLHPIKFIEKQRNRDDVPTGLSRVAVSHLCCPVCLRNFCVDDSFDGPWMESSRFY